MISVDVAGARAEAEQELVALGFSASANGKCWVGVVDVIDRVPLAVLLPSGFPYALPVVWVDRGRLGRQLAHIEKSGKVCIAPSTGLMVDPTQPLALVREAVTRARNIISAGLRGETARDLLEEFGAYWPDVETKMLSFCAPHGRARQIAIGEVGGGDTRQLVVADTTAQLHLIAKRLGMHLKGVEAAYFIPLESPVVPPAFDKVTFVDFVSSLASSLDREQRQLIQKWTDGGQRRLCFLFSFELNEKQGHVVFAVRLRSRLPGVNGFRPGRVPLGAALAASVSDAVDRVSVQRAEHEFLSRRTGSALELKDKRVLVVGCGAIGGYLAVNLADAGVGRLTLVDDDTFQTENTMRHVLGLASVGRSKVEALKNFLEAKLPQVGVNARCSRIEDLLDAEAPFIGGHDLIVLATGDMSLELRLSERLRESSRLVHIWLEAHGVGGHVLVDGMDQPGCLGCLFGHDEIAGLVCRAALCAPGQPFTSSVGGCAGTFTPFGSMDAQRSAIEGARVAIRILTSTQPTGSVLTTWLDTTDPFERGDVLPSARARQLVAGQRVDTIDHAGAGTGCLRCRPR
jgi:molybdopterin/thiamine biosynthesis adenylyltransferase